MDLSCILPSGRWEIYPDGIINSNGLNKYTPKTITSLPKLKAHLEEVKKIGYAVDNEEFNQGVRCVAVSVRNHEGGVIASVGVSGPSTRMKIEDISSLAEILMDVSSQLSNSLGYIQKR